ncbi:non-hydrolyzing UDP-N-acetylglucosamine 2-epimerase [Halorubrum cibi]|uniref:UDP-N-acetylglucosamine 2-epimerase (Non-hydrolysing) n=1 Tax=Halorubrum cibi TaxID=413815 RepID=A0A521C5C1_9EURY|nr:UDP-N-acetylglucosamine 2-epimerase (non-hydrolyzing) [Halorubrum cibi]SMO54031.1 UDP-N-acetylglucosamine 2-epimerase (non-hydrolysing) [Halorubrum cibi]
MRVCSVVGARPQFIKALPVSRRLRADHEEVLIHTGQHYDESLSGIFFEELDIPEPEYNLGVGSGGHASQTAEMMRLLDEVIEAESPDAVLVYGDTNSTLAGALVAAKREPTLAHVESGLRSGKWSMPEEVNRVLTDHCSDLLLAPAENAAANLRANDIRGEVVVTGDVMYDAVLAVRDRVLDASEPLPVPDLRPDEYVLSTVHRASNTDDPDRLAAIVDGLAAVDEPVVLPVHPRTDDALRRHGLYDRAADAIRLVDPVGYVDFLRLLSNASKVATDSGGVQKEAFYLDTPCVTLREETEWVETVETGWNVLVGSDPERIVAALTDRSELPSKPELYGGGDAAARTVAALEAVLADGT